MAFAKVNNVRLSYELHGDSGEPLVFVHGWGGDNSEWRGQALEFSRDYRVLIADNRGHGQSEAPTDAKAYTVEHMAGDIEALVAHAGFERFHLVGQSMGGAVVQEVALRSPERLLSLTLQDTTFWAGDHVDGTGTLPYVPPALAAAFEERTARMSSEALDGAWAGWVGWRGTSDRAHVIRTPTLIIYGDRDASKIVEGSQKLAELIPYNEVAIVAGAGHSPQLECPDVFNAALRRHLERNADARSVDDGQARVS